MKVYLATFNESVGIIPTYKGMPKIKISQSFTKVRIGISLRTAHSPRKKPVGFEF